MTPATLLVAALAAIVPDPDPILTRAMADPVGFAQEHHFTFSQEQGSSAVWVSVPEFEQSRPGAFYRGLGYAVWCTAGADYGTTVAGLRAGFQEGNRTVANPAINLAFHIGGPMAINWGSEKIRKSGHDRVALIFRIVGTVAYGYAAFHNARLIS